MPCHDPSPDERDLRAVNAAKCLNILYEKLGLPYKIGVPTGYDEIGFGKSLDELTNMLCSTIRGLTPEQLEAIVYNGRDKNSRKLADWWDEHQEIDKKRES